MESINSKIEKVDQKELKEPTVIEFDAGPYRVQIISRNLFSNEISSVETEDERELIKGMIRDVMNAPEIVVFKDGQKIVANDFRDFRDKIWKDQISDIDPDRKQLLKKYLSNNLLVQLGHVIYYIDNHYDLKGDKFLVDKWRSQLLKYKLLSDSKYADLNKETRSEIEDLAKEIYNTI